MTPSGGRDWDKELAKIDKQIASMSDDQLRAGANPPARAATEPGAAKAPTRPAAGSGADATRVSPSRAGVMFRVALAVALGIGMTIWPYAARCGVGLAAYLLATAVVMGAGTWAALTTWRARAGRMHIVALLVVAWGIALAAVEVLPRSGYASDPARTSWTCQ